MLGEVLLNLKFCFQISKLHDLCQDALLSFISRRVTSSRVDQGFSNFNSLHQFRN